MKRRGLGIDRFWAGGFLYNPVTDEVLLHQRDGNTKFNPNMWAFFGGLREGSETPAECFLREIKEELNIILKENEIVPLCDYLNEELQTYRYVFYVTSNLSKNTFILGEGRGFDWVPLTKLDEYDLTEKTRKDLRIFILRLRGSNFL